MVHKVLRVLCAPAVLVLALAGAVATAGPAQATTDISCLYNWRAGNTELGHGTKAGGTPIHIGPYGECNVVATVANTRTLIYDCSVVNDYQNGWTHVRVQSSTTQGWVYNAYLSGGGSGRAC